MRARNFSWFTRLIVISISMAKEIGTFVWDCEFFFFEFGFGIKGFSLNCFYYVWFGCSYGSASATIWRWLSSCCWVMSFSPFLFLFIYFQLIINNHCFSGKCHFLTEKNVFCFGVWEITILFCWWWCFGFLFVLFCFGSRKMVFLMLMYVSVMVFLRGTYESQCIWWRKWFLSFDLVTWMVEIKFKEN